MQKRITSKLLRLLNLKEVNSLLMLCQLVDCGTESKYARRLACDDTLDISLLFHWTYELSIGNCIDRKARRSDIATAAKAAALQLAPYILADPGYFAWHADARRLLDGNSQAVLMQQLGLSES